MNTMNKLTVSALIAIFAVACGASEKKDNPNDKKAQLEKLKTEQAKINEQVRTLEEDLAKTDTAYAKKLNEKLVVVTPVATKPFSHYIELQGRIDAENIVYVSPRGMGGQVKALYVKQGDRISKGQLLLKLDNAVALS
ncbi:MAG: biotin/lipoyl-binding protein, partial [Chitinophagaceae bacterium]|nr:biotin/lipoyl-binding protein [Chitinophagaceae bacterium]